LADWSDGDPAQWNGAPIGLQVIGQRLEEEKVVGMLADWSDGDPAQWNGAPIGLQVIGQRLEEEKVVGMLCAIRDAMEEKLS